MDQPDSFDKLEDYLEWQRWERGNETQSYSTMLFGMSSAAVLAILYGLNKQDNSSKKKPTVPPKKPIVSPSFNRLPPV